MHIEPFYDQQTSTFTYVIVDTNSATTAVIDAVLDYDQDAARATTENADQVIAYIQENNYTNQWILETHIHADHISAAHYLKQQIGGMTGIGSAIKNVLRMWIPIFDSSTDTPIDGSQYDRLFNDNEVFEIGTLKVKVIHTPGHTPACACYLIDNSIFVGDTLFTPKMGTARVDFPGGSAKDLYHSIQKIYQLPGETQIYLCHDYPDEGEQPTFLTTVDEQKAHNKMLNSATELKEFSAIRHARDQQLSVPKLILPSIQSNMRLGDFGEASDNGIVYIKIPLNTL